LKSRYFYPLEQVAEMLDTTTEYLVHMAAWNYDGKSIPIYILTAHFDVSAIHVDEDGAVDEYPLISTTKVKKLSMQCLQELDAGNQDAVVSFDRRPYYEFDDSDDNPLLTILTKPVPVNGYWIKGLRRRNVDYPLFYELKPRKRSGTDTDPTYPEPIKISECKMVVLAEDLEIFQHDKTEPTTVPLSENERDKLLKQIGLLALVLAEKSNRYKRGKKPNAFQIAKDAQLIIDAAELPGKKGTGSSELRDSISQGLKLLIDD
jgi:hypothetical protein